MESIQEILKNSDLIVDPLEIHRVVEQVLLDQNFLELQFKGEPESFRVTILKLHQVFQVFQYRATYSLNPCV